MPISRAQPADLPELAELFAGYLDFYQVPRPLPEVITPRSISFR